MSRTNWSGQFAIAPNRYAEPTSVEELSQIVGDTSAYPSPVVALGSKHSNSGCTTMHAGTGVSMKAFRTPMRLDDQQTFTGGGGLQLFEVHRWLAQRGLQLQFHPEIGNATLGSVACCCLKDAALGEGTGLAAQMVRGFSYVDARGELRHAKRGDEDWLYVSSSHGLAGLIVEVTLDVVPMQAVRQHHTIVDLEDAGWEQRFDEVHAENDGMFSLLDATGGKYILEARNLAPGETPNPLERATAKLDQSIFMYFNPALGLGSSKRWTSLVRRGARTLWQLTNVAFPNGARSFKSLKPVDYSVRYPFRWEFHFWAFPRERFAQELVPQFLAFLSGFKERHPSFDEQGFMACYRLRRDRSTMLSPTWDGDRITMDPVRPMPRDPADLALWDRFLEEYNEFAAEHGGTCTFNQTKHLSRSVVERAFGPRWDDFKAAREAADPDGRFLSGYFDALMYGPADA